MTNFKKLAQCFQYALSVTQLLQGIFGWFMTMQEKQILERAAGTQKENWGNQLFFTDIELKFGKKMPYMLRILQVLELCLVIISEKCVVTHIFLFGFQIEALAKISFSRVDINCAKLRLFQEAPSKNHNVAVIWKNPVLV